MTISVRTQKRMKTQIAQKRSDRCTRRQPRGGVAPFGHKQRYAAHKEAVEDGGEMAVFQQPVTKKPAP